MTSPKRPTKIGFLHYWLVWTFFGCYLSIAAITENRFGTSMPWWISVYLEMTGAYSAALLFPLARWGFYFNNLYQQSWWKQLVVHFLLSPVITLLACLIMDMLRYPFVLWMADYFPQNWYDWIWVKFWTRFLLEWPRVGLVYAAMVLVLVWRQRELNQQQSELKAAQLHNELSELKISALKSQLQPHFLFNTLNMISDFIHTQPDVAERILHQISNLLRYYLAQNESPLVSLNTELRMANEYVSILQQRFPERIQYSQSIGEGALVCSVPSMFLQPLLENCVVHSIQNNRGNVLIQLGASIKDQRLKISLSNTLSDKRSRNERLDPGIGLQNVREQLNCLYQNNASIELELDEDKAIVRVELPVSDKSEISQ